MVFMLLSCYGLPINPLVTVTASKLGFVTTEICSTTSLDEGFKDTMSDYVSNEEVLRRENVEDIEIILTRSRFEARKKAASRDS